MLESIDTTKNNSLGAVETWPLNIIDIDIQWRMTWNEDFPTLVWTSSKNYACIFCMIWQKFLQGKDVNNCISEIGTNIYIYILWL